MHLGHGADAPGPKLFLGMFVVPPSGGSPPLLVSMHRLHREGRDAHGDVLRAVRSRRAVLNPFSMVRDDRLPGMNVDDTTLVRHPEHPFEHDTVFVELRRLPGFDPARWT